MKRYLPFLIIGGVLIVAIAAGAALMRRPASAANRGHDSFRPGDASVNNSKG
ncbi:MAG: hypothetical protein WKF84_21515 [Pyrinomonadaceae bacterium]